MVLLKRIRKRVFFNNGSKVFMDAYGTVTAEERDRYPLGPPNL